MVGISQVTAKNMPVISSETDYLLNIMSYIPSLELYNLIQQFLTTHVINNAIKTCITITHTQIAITHYHGFTGDYHIITHAIKMNDDTNTLL